MMSWMKLGARGGSALGAVSLAAMIAAQAASAGDVVQSGDTVTVTMTRAQYEALMNVLPRVEELERQVQDNQQNLQIQGGQQQQIEEKISAVRDGVPDQHKLVEDGKRGVNLELSGQVNVGVLYADSGDGPAAGVDADDDDRKVWIVDNDNSSTRFRLIADAPVDEYLTLGALIEVQLEQNSSSCVNQTVDSGDDCEFKFEGGALRKAEAIVDHKKYGKLRFGQGDTASNGISEQDLSGTSVVAYSSIKDVGGGLLFRDSTGALTGVDVGDFFDNLDGLSRKERVRYDTPKLPFGVSFASSYVDGGAYDARVQHSYKWPVLGGVKVAAAAGWYNEFETNGEEGISGSGSFLHEPTGLNLTGAGGTTLNQGVEQHFYYVKGGWQGTIFDFGKTAVSADAWMGKNFEEDGVESDSYGIQFVQNVSETSTELYIGGRVFMVDNFSEDLQDIYTVLAGARQKF